MTWIDFLKWKAYRAWVWPLSKVGHWEYEHGFKECPSGERHCPHAHYRLGEGQ